jgi:hypothetical protein
MRLRVLRTRRSPRKSGAPAAAFLRAEGGRCYAVCADGEVVELLGLELDGRPLSAQELANRIGDRKLPLH